MLHSDFFYLTGWSNLQTSITVNCRLKSIVYRQYNEEVSEQRHAMSNEKMDYTQQGNRLPFQCIFSYGFYRCDSGANLRVFTKGGGGGCEY